MPPAPLAPLNTVFIVEVMPRDPAGGHGPLETYGVVAPDRAAALARLNEQVEPTPGAVPSIQGELDTVSARIFSFDLDETGQVKRIMRHGGPIDAFQQRQGR